MRKFDYVPYGIDVKSASMFTCESTSNRTQPMFTGLCNALCEQHNRLYSRHIFLFTDRLMIEARPAVARDQGAPAA